MPTQVVQVYLQPFRRNSFLKCAPQPKIEGDYVTTRHYNLLSFKVQGRSRSSMLTPFKSSSLVLVMISSMSVPICNCFHARQANSGKITTF